MIIAIGDVHGKFNLLSQRMKEITDGVTGVNFVQVGDFGIGFEHPRNDFKELSRLNDILIDRSSMMYIIRGNHDNPSFWHKGCGFSFSNIQFVSDGSTLQIDDMVCYFAGGAYSVDRARRHQGIDYWSGELFVDSSDELHQKIDVLFTHDVYHPCSPFTIYGSETVRYFQSEDPFLIGDLQKSQIRMEELYNKILNTNPTFTWYHGHYHESHVTNNNEQITHSLSELEFKEVR